MNTKVLVSAIIGALIVYGNQLVPVLPAVWGNLISAILGVVALYYHAQTVSAARQAGAKGV